jgi:acetyl esterase/lipase
LSVGASRFVHLRCALRGLPPALVLTAGNDVLRDEGEEHARKLDAAGVDVIAVRYSRMIHDWELLNPISQVPAVRTSLLQVGEELKRRLRQPNVLEMREFAVGGVAGS